MWTRPVARGLLVLGPDRYQPPPDDDEDEDEREGDVPDRLRRRAGSTNFSRCVKTSRNAVPMTISGVTRVASETRVPCLSPAAPAGQPDRERDAKRHRDENRDGGQPQALEERGAESGSCQTERSGSSKYQRSDHPWAVERERPSLNENRIAMRIGTIDQIR